MRYAKESTNPTMPTWVLKKEIITISSSSSTLDAQLGSYLGNIYYTYIYSQEFISYL